ncbi:MAG: twin-arginine translocase TatA/TatE family subunit [Rhodospirillales bacterium]|nr:twin-arginine translocase TatA/TatE family subunit [Rhodospirillales bacterium]
MGTFSVWHWVIVLAIVLILFGGGGKLSKLMGDFGKGLKSFKKGLKDGEGDESAAEDPSIIGSIAASLDPKPRTPPSSGAHAPSTDKPEKA